MKKSSILHRLLGLAPGTMPNWLLSKNNCYIFGFLPFIGAVLLISLPYLFHVSLLIGIVSFLFYLLFIVKIYIPFESVERHARAIKRRESTK